MLNISFNKERCVGCGACKRDCTCEAIDIREQKAVIDTSLCNKCGHCIAVCPQEALTAENSENMQGCISTSAGDKSMAPEPEDFLDYLKLRRSIRWYKKREIEAAKIDAIVEAGRYSPTAGNRQRNRFIILQDNIELVRNKAIKTLYDVAQNREIDLGRRERYRKTWTRMYNDYISGKRDRLFFNAPVVILVVGDADNDRTDVDGGIAAARMEIEANALGLGVCYIGFLNTAIMFDNSIRELVGLKNEDRLAVTFVTGYPDVKYYRPAPKNPASVKKL